MLMIFTVLKASSFWAGITWQVLFVSINAMHIGMTWYSELAAALRNPAELESKPGHACGGPRPCGL